MPEYTRQLDSINLKGGGESIQYLHQCLAGIQTKYLTNTSQKHYCLIKPASYYCRSWAQKMGREGLDVLIE
jgi:hypothetical protein